MGPLGGQGRKKEKRKLETGWLPAGGDDADDPGWRPHGPKDPTLKLGARLNPWDLKSLAEAVAALLFHLFALQLLQSCTIKNLWTSLLMASTCPCHCSQAHCFRGGFASTLPIPSPLPPGMGSRTWLGRKKGFCHLGRTRNRIF